MSDATYIDASAASVQSAQSAAPRDVLAQPAAARDVLARLYALRRAAHLYPLEHPVVLESLDALEDAVRSLQSGGSDVRFAFAEGEITLGDSLLPEESLLFDQLVRDLNAVGIGFVAFRYGFDRSELVRAATVLAADQHAVEGAGGIRSLVQKAHLAQIEIGEAVAIDRSGEQVELTPVTARSAYEGAIDLMRDIDLLATGGDSIDARAVSGAVRTLVAQVTRNQTTMLQLTGLRSFDEYTYYHSANVAILSVALGSVITHDGRFLTSLGTGALLHDIGKLAIPKQILNKPGVLSVEEWERMRDHPIIGTQMAATARGMDRSALMTILEHHMRFDGSGYPQRDSARGQHIMSRIVAVADAYDAMTSTRSYSAARPNDEAMAMVVRSAGTALDPELVRLFVQLMGVYPPRTLVRLDTREIGVVLAANRVEPARPVVRVFADPDGEHGPVRDVDLAEERTISIRSCLDACALGVDVEDYL